MRYLLFCICLTAAAQCARTVINPITGKQDCVSTPAGSTVSGSNMTLPGSLKVGTTVPTMFGPALGGSLSPASGITVGTTTHDPILGFVSPQSENWHVTSGLVLLYAMRQGSSSTTLYDQGGSALNGSLTGTSWITNSILRFPGGGYGSSVDVSALDGNTNWSVVLVARRKEVIPAASEQLWDYGAGVSAEATGLQLTSTGTFNQFQWGQADNSVGSYTPNQWMVLVMTKSSNTGTVYLNTVSQGTMAYSALNLTYAAHIIGGLVNSPTAQSLIGNVLYLAIYNRVLSASDVALIQTDAHNALLARYPDPIYQGFQINTLPMLNVTAGVVDAVIAGDPFIYKGTSAYTMLYNQYASPPGKQQCGSATSPTLDYWTKQGTFLTYGVSGYDVNGAGKCVGITIGSTFQGYYESSSAVPVKTISHFSCSLDGNGDPDLSTCVKDAAHNPVLSPGTEVDGSTSAWLMAPSIVEVSGAAHYVVYAAQNASDLKFRCYYATINPDGTLTRSGSAALLAPSSSGWDSGWVACGNIVPYRGQYVMPYNAGGTVPGSVSTESDPRGIGFAFATSALGPYAKYADNPMTPSGFTGGTFQSVWRGYLTLWRGPELWLNAGDAGSPSVERTYIAQPSIP